MEYETKFTPYCFIMKIVKTISLCANNPTFLHYIMNDYAKRLKIYNMLLIKKLGSNRKNSLLNSVAVLIHRTMQVRSAKRLIKS